MTTAFILLSPRCNEWLGKVYLANSAETPLMRCQFDEDGVYVLAGTDNCYRNENEQLKSTKINFFPGKLHATVIFVSLPTPVLAASVKIQQNCVNA